MKNWIVSRWKNRHRHSWEHWRDTTDGDWIYRCTECGMLDFV